MKDKVYNSSCIGFWPCSHVLINAWKPWVNMNNFMSLNMHIQGVLLANKVEIPSRSQPRHLGGPTLKVGCWNNQSFHYSMIFISLIVLLTMKFISGVFFFNQWLYVIWSMFHGQRKNVNTFHKSKFPSPFFYNFSD